MTWKWPLSLCSSSRIIIRQFDRSRLKCHSKSTRPYESNGKVDGLLCRDCVRQRDLGTVTILLFWRTIVPEEKLATGEPYNVFLSLRSRDKTRRHPADGLRDTPT